MYEFIDKCGKKRKGIKYTCKYCKQEFINRAYNTKKYQYKYCSINCKRLDSRKEIQVVCSWCKTEFNKKPSQLPNSKSGLYFCTRKCKDEAQKLGGIKEIMPSHFGKANGKNQYRQQFTTKELICKRCEYKEFSCAVEIHHIDHNRENNNKENLIPLCANCHAALHNKQWELNNLLCTSTSLRTEP
jgi:hypothetical protein